MFSRILLTVLVLFTFSPLVYCGDSKSTKKSHKSGAIFAGGGVGLTSGPSNVAVAAGEFPPTSYSSTIINQTHDFAFTNRDAIFYVVEIGYNFNEYFGLYVDYNDWGIQQIESINGVNFLFNAPGLLQGGLKTYSFGPGIVGYLPLHKGAFDIFASAGVEFMEPHLNFLLFDSTSVNQFKPGTYQIESDFEIAIPFSFGMEMNFDKYISLRLGFKSVFRVSETPIGNLAYDAFYSEFIFHYAI